ncbi:MAG: hypothetical protein HGB12_07185 [Bacteroidetes bacterium]|nr:hypothetical protein [Bacteroidota bacterium]
MKKTSVFLFVFCITLLANAKACKNIVFTFYNPVVLRSAIDSATAIDPPVAISGSGATYTQITANWNTSVGATTYHLDVSTSIGFANFVTGFNNYNAGNVTSCVVTGLFSCTAYYYRVRAENTCNTSVNSNIISYSTLDPCGGIPTITDIDGNVYNTVCLGTQCWMKENLKTGTLIPISTHQTNNGILEKYCYNNDIAHCDSSGAIYQWAEAMQYKDGCSNTASLQPTPAVKGICPTGWHIPVVAEWNTLTTYLGGESVAGGKMKVTPICGTKPCWKTPNSGATNSSGFSAFSSGESYNEGSSGFANNSYYANYWTSTESLATAGRAYRMDYNNTQCAMNSKYKTSGLSIRCVKD